MRSRANIKSHPLHPILIPFPIAFFAGAVVFDILQLVTENASFGMTAFYLLVGGIAMGLIAALPGLVDLIATVPPGSSAQKRGITHAILNVCMIALFAAALVYRQGNASPSPVIYMALEIAGLALMFIAGWMGGTLVHRNQIGVDPRYAFAGKWKERFLEVVNGQVEFARPEDLKRDQMMLLHVSGKRIVLARTEKGLAAFDDHCTHRGGSLAGGMMICATVQCPWHGSQFDVQTGEVKAGPAHDRIATYRVEEVGEKVRIYLKS